MQIISLSCYTFKYSTNSTQLSYSKLFYMFRQSGLVGREKRGGQTNIERKEIYTHFTDEEMQSQMSMPCPRSHRAGNNRAWPSPLTLLVSVLTCFHITLPVPRNKQIHEYSKDTNDKDGNRE